jgi:PAS domain S-box-containing protein
LKSVPVEQSVLLEALKSISQGVLIAGPDRRMIFANEAFESITGYPAEDVIGRSCRVLQGPDTDSRTIALIQIALDSAQTFSGEILNYRKSGAPFWNELTITPLKDSHGAVTHFIGITRDVTARRAAVTDLENAEQRYRLLFDHAQAGIVLHGSATEILYANATASTLLGVGRRDILGVIDADPRWRFVTEDGLPLPLEAYPVNRAIAERAPVKNLVAGVLRDDDERIVWLMCNAYPIFDRDGDLREVVVSFTDVTELKQTERALHKSEERLRLILRGANDAAWDWDIENNECYYSPRWWQMLGYRENEVPGDPDLWRRLLHPRDRAHVDEVVSRALDGGDAVFEIQFRMRHKDGHYVPVRARSFVLRNAEGRPIRISGTNSDETERERSAAALRQSEASLRAVVDASPVPTMLTDHEGNLTYLNPASVESFGYVLAEVPTIGAWRERVYPDPDYRRWVETMWAKRLNGAPRAQRASEPLELVIRCKDGSERTVRATSVGLQGDAVGARLIVLLDVTEQRRLERSALEAASREQQRIGMDLHDGLGQELTGLSLSLAALARRAKSAKDPAIDRDLQDLAMIAANCIATTRSIAHGLSPVEPGCDGLERALRRLENENPRGGLSVSVSVGGYKQLHLEQPVGEAIFRIVQEALTNAAKHGRASHASVEARFLVSGVRVVVRDNGTGIAAATPTAGFGLKFMRYRAHAIGGHVDIESPAGGGTTVTGTFPVKTRGTLALVAGRAVP